MKRIASLFGLSALAVLALGMGSLTGEIDPQQVPKPAINFKAKVVDRADSVVEVEELSFDGDTFLKGDLGASQIAVSFDKIKAIDFNPTEDGKKVKAAATLADGTTVEVVMTRNLDIFGKASFGIYRVKTKDAKRIEIHGRK